MSKLPIEVVPSSRPPRFRWRQLVHGPGRSEYVEREGPVEASMEVALVEVIQLARSAAEMQQEILGLRKQNEELHARLAALSEQVNKKAEGQTRRK